MTREEWIEYHLARAPVPSDDLLRRTAELLAKHDMTLAEGEQAPQGGPVSKTRPPG